jgi:uncharacterized protein (DUF1697 family)
MSTFISILRGINVGGHKKILMEDLKKVYEAMGFTEITTYVQSGNVIFKTAQNNSDPLLSDKIENAIKEKYSFHVPVIIRTVDEMRLTISSNPFLQEDGIDSEKLHVTFLDQEPSPTDISAITRYDFSPDRFRILGKEVYLYCPESYGNTKLSNDFFEKKLHVKATTRNWKTVLRLGELSG